MKVNRNNCFEDIVLEIYVHIIFFIALIHLYTLNLGVYFLQFMHNYRSKSTLLDIFNEQELSWI